ncbi:Wzz/FepE/Etk N-terminal domain-containing protein [Chitinophaga eiseniae]|uniref:Lipopolysaccharide biosynthesis protein n=1 Tax=Chitinophaga eiseniae TaxID=634771 RepID=A0A847SEK6_9BACT|nr:Wzz/FepE/Etk N-terminal domain-containing protein [Chitinophaga eiseniae]NLR78614.1 lipopolysaccharide biosynthesis protein [Chitinophaga eiseniae]
MDQYGQNIAGDTEMSIKELILKARKWINFLLTKWLIIAIVGILGIGLGIFYSVIKRPTYKAELTFIVEDNKSNPLSAYAGIASQFGIDLSGTSTSGVFAGDNIIGFLKSRLMIEKALLTEAVNVNKKMTLADLYISINEKHKQWKKKIELANISFPVDVDRKKFSLVQDSVLGELCKEILEKNLIVEKVDKKLSFIAVSCDSKSEFFSQQFTENLVKDAIDFYVDTKTLRSKSNVDKLQQKADSMEQLLNRKTYAAATIQDINQNPAKRIATVGLELDSRDKMILQTIYGEVLKNLEVSKMSMLQDIPLIQVIDKPILPLKQEKLGKLKGAIFGGFVAVFFACVILILRKLYAEVMA